MRASAARPHFAVRSDTEKMPRRCSTGPLWRSISGGLLSRSAAVHFERRFRMTLRPAWQHLLANCRENRGGAHNRHRPALPRYKSVGRPSAQVPILRSTIMCTRSAIPAEPPSCTTQFAGRPNCRRSARLTAANQICDGCSMNPHACSLRRAGTMNRVDACAINHSSA
jgi:hypothetical protein